MKYELPDPSGEYLIVSAMHEENPPLKKGSLALMLQIETELSEMRHVLTM